MRTSVRVTAGRPDWPVAVILPGVGSSADFVTRTFGPPLVAAGLALASADPCPGRAVVTAAFDALDDARARFPVRVVGGVSLGAHVAARWAARRFTRTGEPPLDGILLALPAWTGEPGFIAAATAATAARVRALGPAAALADARRHAVPWIADELARAWPGYGLALADTLDRAARSPGPTVSELAGIPVPAGLAAFTDDPVHPLEVAEQWQAALPRSAVRRLALADCAVDRSVLGRAAVAAWRRARRPAAAG